MKNILVIDDDDAISEALKVMLETTGYAVTISRTGQIVYSLKKDFPDLILLDIWLSGVDGRDVLAAIRRHEKLKSIPVIMISANNDAEQIAQEASADDFLSKPFEMKDLLEKVGRLLQ